VDIEFLTGISAGILTSISLLPQLIKIVKEKEAEDVSPAMLIILLCGVILWIVYGVMKKDLPIIITNSFSAFTNIILIFLVIKYKKAKK
jgi:MtN3 and saliva related transmembrane protein